MARYIDADELEKITRMEMRRNEAEILLQKKVRDADMGFIAGVHSALNIIKECPTAYVVPKSEVAELLRLMFNDDCACNYNGNDEWLPFKCKYALTDCPMPQERLGCWMEFVEYGLAELKKKYEV